MRLYHSRNGYYPLLIPKYPLMPKYYDALTNRLVLVESDRSRAMNRIEHELVLEPYRSILHTFINDHPECCKWVADISMRVLVEWCDQCASEEGYRPHHSETLSPQERNPGYRSW